MDDKISKAISEVWEGENAQNILKTISANVWNKIEFARERKGLKIYETTVTQDILSFVMFAALETKFDIKLFEAKAEKTNGNDIECYVETEKGFLFLPMQAKIIYKNFKYTQIDHQVGKRKKEQIDLLIKYAKEKKGYPLYLLYNYYKGEKLIKDLEDKTKMAHQLFGVSYIDAFFLRNNYYQKRTSKKGKKTWKIPSFKDLHPYPAKAFHQILDKKSLSGDGYNFIIENFQSENNNLNLKMYTREELMDDEDWIDLTPAPSIGRLQNDFDENKFIKGEIGFRRNEFNPKFRMILSSKKITRVLGYIS